MPARRRSSKQLRRPMAVPAQSARGVPVQQRIPRLRRHAAPGVPPRNRALLREHRARGSQRPRPAARRLHVRQRTSRAPLRHRQRQGEPFRRVTLGADSLRRGLLGQGSILTVTSYPDRTSPVVRGKWILENLLGTPPPPPLPNVPPLAADVCRRAVFGARADGAAPRQSGVCELPPHDGPARPGAREFRWRRPVARAGASRVGAHRRVGSAARRPAFDGAGRPDAKRCSRRTSSSATVTEKLLTYALGRGLEHYDAPAVRAIVRDAAPHDYRLSAMIQGRDEHAVPHAPRRLVGRDGAERRSREGEAS